MRFAQFCCRPRATEKRGHRARKNTEYKQEEYRTRVFTYSAMVFVISILRCRFPRSDGFQSKIKYVQVMYTYITVCRSQCYYNHYTKKHRFLLFSSLRISLSLFFRCLRYSYHPP